MKDFFEDFRTALMEVANVFLIVLPIFKKEKEIAKKIVSKK